MSSSRSIAAARNRRSGDQTQPPPQTPRPTKSINGQSAFAPPHQQMQQQQQQSQFRRPATAQGVPQQQNMPGSKNISYQQSAQPQVSAPTALPKRSISDAIALITIRLGRVEQFVIDLQADEGFAKLTESGNNNSQLVDNSVITSVVNRLNSLEKKDTALDKNANANAFLKLDNEIRDIKDLLLSHTVKYDKFTNECERKISEFMITIEQKLKTITENNAEQITDIHTALKTLEDQMPQFEYINGADLSASIITTEGLRDGVNVNDENEINVNSDDLEEHETIDNNIASIDLKTAIQLELSETRV